MIKKINAQQDRGTTSVSLQMFLPACGQQRCTPCNAINLALMHSLPDTCIYTPLIYTRTMHTHTRILLHDTFTQFSISSLAQT